MQLNTSYNRSSEKTEVQPELDNGCINNSIKRRLIIEARRTEFLGFDINIVNAL